MGFTAIVWREGGEKCMYHLVLSAVNKEHVLLVMA